MADLDYVSLAASLLGQPAAKRGATSEATWPLFSNSGRLDALVWPLFSSTKAAPTTDAAKAAAKQAQEAAAKTQDAIQKAQAARTQQPPAATQAAAPTSAGLAAAFPNVARWDPLIQQNAQATGVDPAIWYAVTEAESGGDPNIGSPAGALGVLQHMPDWGTEAQRRDPAWSYQTARPRFQQAYNALDEARQYGWNVDDPVERALWTIARGQVYESEWPNNLTPAYQNPQAPSNQRVRDIVRRAYAAQGRPAAPRPDDRAAALEAARPSSQALYDAMGVPRPPLAPGEGVQPLPLAPPQGAPLGPGEGVQPLPLAPPRGTPLGPGEGIQPLASLATAGPFGGKPLRVDFDFALPYGGAQWAGGPSHHRGVDITPVGSGIGEPVTAMRRGRVVYADSDPNGGNGLIVQELDRNGQPVTLPDGAPVNIAYFHLAQPAPFQVGQTVEQGQVIGQMGQSGTEGFPHLHLEVRRNANRGDPRGTEINPFDYFPELRALRQ